MCKMIISVGLFFFFSKLGFFGFLEGWKGKKWSKMTKILSIVHHMSGTIHLMIAIYGIHVQNDNISILILRVVRGIKGQKTTQNDKKFCLSHLISQEPFIWSSFMVDICKKIISPSQCFFYFFKMLVFWAKALHILGSIHHMIVNFGTHV